MGSCERKETVLDEHVAMLALLARCRAPIFSRSGMEHEDALPFRVKMMSHVHINVACGLL